MFYADPSGADAIWSPNNTSQNSYKPGDYVKPISNGNEEAALQAGYDSYFEKNMAAFAHWSVKVREDEKKKGNNTSQGKKDDWVPKKNGNLLATQRETARTLANALGITRMEAIKLISTLKIDYDYDKKTGIYYIPIGTEIKLNNSVADRLKDDSPYSKEQDDYMCQECHGMASKNEKLTRANAAGDREFPSVLNGYTRVKDLNGVPMAQGAAIIGYLSPTAHVVSNYSVGQGGTLYVSSKYRSEKVEIMTLQEAIDSWNQLNYTNFTIEDVAFYRKNN